MRAMVRLGDIYKQAGMEKEYVGCLTTAVELFAGDSNVTFELLNILIDRVNRTRTAISEKKTELKRMRVDPETLTENSVPSSEPMRSAALAYLEELESLDTQYNECYRLMRVSCGQIPYNAELYYRTASLQYLRAEEDGDRDKYKDAINWLQRAIASDSGHIESYHLIALAYEKLGDNDRAVRFWRLFEVIYEIAPEVMGKDFLTPQRESLHYEAMAHLDALGASKEE